MSADTPRCGDQRDIYTCTLKPHNPRIDHADQVIAPNGVMAASYTRAFWNTDRDVVVVDPYASAVEVAHKFEHVNESVPEFCVCGAAFVEGYHLEVVKAAHINAHANIARVAATR